MYIIMALFDINKYVSMVGEYTRDGPDEHIVESQSL